MHLQPNVDATIIIEGFKAANILNLCISVTFLAMRFLFLILFLFVSLYRFVLLFALFYLFVRLFVLLCYDMCVCGGGGLLGCFRLIAFFQLD